MRLNETALDKLLRNNGYTRKELCKEIGMSEATFSRTINYKHGDFRVTDLFKMAKALQYSIVELIGFVYEEEK